MPRWLRVLRGMLGIGLTFSIGVGTVAAVLAGIAALLPGVGIGPETIRVVVGSAVWAFPVGVAFSGFTALTARGRRFEELSLPRFGLLGAGAGLALFGLLALNAWNTWTADAAIVNATVFVLLGSGAATGSLLLARRAGSALDSGDVTPSLEAGAHVGKEHPS